MARYVVAVSGGVDSVVLLDMLSQVNGHELIVAHFDHGIRDDSSDDGLFVGGLAAKYGYEFETIREELGPDASEQRARDRRYAFLRSVAEKHNARIVTAHHADDTVETIAINLHRGTGWRGLAVLDSGIVRPLLQISKADLLAYAAHRNLEWHQDSTNASDTYLRNRLRGAVAGLDGAQKAELLKQRESQINLKKDIDAEVRRLIGGGPSYSRYFFSHVPKNVGIECLRAVVDAKLTRPQLERALMAIKTALPKSSYQAGTGITFDFTTRNFSLSLLK